MEFAVQVAGEQARVEGECVLRALDEYTEKKVYAAPVYKKLLTLLLTFQDTIFFTVFKLLNYKYCT